MSNLFDSTKDDQPKLEAWSKCISPPGFDGSIWRWDAFGSVIRWSDYGDRSSEYGWEIDHAVPSILGGGDGLHNLRALHWRNNASLGGALSGASASLLDYGGNALSGLGALGAYENALKRIR